MSEEIQDVVNSILITDDFYKKAQYIDFLRKEKNMSLANISRALNLKPSYTAHIIRLLKLPDIIIDGYYSKLVSATHLFIISRLKDQEQMMQIYEKVLAESLSVQQTEDAVREILHGIKADDSMLSKEEIADFNKKFKEIFKDVEFKIIQTRIRGKIVCEIKGSSQDTSLALRRLAEKLTTDSSGVKRVKKNLFILE